MGTSREWKRIARISANSMYWLTDPISALGDLRTILDIAEHNMAVGSFPNFTFMFRGQDDFPLAPKTLTGVLDIEKLRAVFRELIEECKDKISGNHTDNEIYFMMRHSGLPSHLVDWSCRWDVALWFAMHNADGGIKNGTSSLWVLRPTLDDVKVTLFPADQHLSERSENQEGWAYSIRFVNGIDGVRVLSMECDDLYRGRLLRIPIDMGAYKSLETELLSFRPEVSNVMSPPPPLPSDTIEKCRAIFRSKMGL